jgi:hypothetical protein
MQVIFELIKVKHPIHLVQSTFHTLLKMFLIEKLHVKLTKLLKGMYKGKEWELRGEQK